jgi:hypothetical protein
MAAISTILLTLHLLSMNVASAGPLVCVWLAIRGRRGDVAAWQMGRQLSHCSLAALLLGVATGLALGVAAWFDSSQSFAEAIQRFPTSAVANFIGEVAFALVCLSVYAGLWERWRARPWWHGLFAVLAATNLLYHFPPLMVVMDELAVRPELVAEPIVSRPVFRPLMLRPDVLSQSLHFVVASVAVVGAALIVIASRQRAVMDQDGSERLISAGARIALAASLAQLAIGVWVLFELPPDARGGLMGDAWPATGLFMAAMVMSVGLLNTLGTMALGDTSSSSVRRCILLMLGVVLLMATILRVVRSDQFVAKSGSSTTAAITNQLGD